MIQSLFCEMIKYYHGDPKRIQHFTKVHAYSKLIGEIENLDEDTLFVLETAAVVHDIGIKVSEEKYGQCGGKLQEQEGPTAAKEMLERLGFEKAVVERVCYLVGHHHTYMDIDGLDYQILVEADFLVNMYEDDLTKESIISVYDKIFRTEMGRHICRDMFGI